MTLFKRTITPFQIAAVGLGFLILLISLQVVLFAEQRSKAQESDRWVIHTYRVIDKIETLFGTLRDAETSQRGYLITSDPAFLTVYQDAVAVASQAAAQPDGQFPNIDRMIGEIRALISDNPKQLARLDRLAVLINKKLRYIARSITVHDTQGAAAAQALVKQGEGKQLMDDIRRLVAEMSQSEDLLLAKRSQQHRKLDERFSIFIAIAALVTYGSLLVTILLIVSNFARIRRVEKQLYEKETFFRAAAEASTDPFFLYRIEKLAHGGGENLVLQFANPAAERAIGHPLAMMVDKPIEAIFNNHPTPTSQLKEIYLRALRTNTSYENEFSVTAGGLRGHTFTEQASPFVDGIAIIFRDITERKAMERMKSEFVSTVSHELRTPLTSIRGSLGLIAGGVTGEISDQAKNLITIAYNNCERLVRLINDILDIEKIESGKMLFDIKSVELYPIVQQSIQANQSFADKYQARMRLVENEVPRDVRVMADTDRTIQVITNLLSNAAKYSPPNGEITLRLSQTTTHLRVEVEDQGGGIPLEFQERIFQKFAQADSSDTRQKGGTGLGLNIVKAMVEEMGGKVGFTSEVGKGALFYFTLPLAETKTVAPRAAAPNQAASRLLVCEDEPDIANLLGMILERAGFAVDYASNANEALALLNQNSYMAMTLDLMLPDKCGINFIRELRDMPAFRTLPIIVVSAKADKGKTMMNGDAIGVVDWMSKPIDMERLVSLVRNLHLPNKRADILHVEDDADIAEIIRLSLKELADIDHAETLRQAKEYLSHTHYDLVVLDVGLPDGQGTDLLPILRGEHHKTTPVVLFTAGEVPADISSQVAAALTKSRTSEEKLLETIQRLINQQPPSHR